MKRKNNRCKLIILVAVSILFSTWAILPLKIAIAKKQAPHPQAILTLGGGQQREVFTAKFALSHPQLPIWVSSGSKELRAREIFQKEGLSNRRIYLDRRATDTVTNFTTLVKDFKKQKIQHIYLITDDFHLPRAKAIAFVILGIKGIAYTPVEIVTDRLSEAKIKIVRDVLRSTLWIFTKQTGSEFRRN